MSKAEIGALDLLGWRNAAKNLLKVLDTFELPVHKMKVGTYIGPSYFLCAVP